MKKALLLLVSHAIVAGAGFAAGIYLLPIIAAPPAPDAGAVRASAEAASFTAEFRRDLPGSDALHWGEGIVHVGRASIALDGAIAPGPAYRLYLSPRFVRDEAEFLAARPRMVAVGDIRTFRNFIVPVPADVRITDYDTVVVWCEAFSQFITAAKYR